MGALPKQRVSPGRQGNRRRFHVLKLPQLMTCPTCGEKKETHHVCPNCGTYKGRQVLDVNKRARRAQAE
ncbi:MAG: 50S ribosomal protein L32 [Thermomicrobiaceae bacterium]|nr:50S ribosomal protein L32 [Thermomicrobiaceae bacterium]